VAALSDNSTKENSENLSNPTGEGVVVDIAKGGLPNVLFIQSSIENLPEELNETADEIHIHFPWGSLLRAVACGDESVLENLRRICVPECLLEIIIGIDERRDKSEIERLGLPVISAEYLETFLIPKYAAAGFEIVEKKILQPFEWSQIETSWARKLQTNDRRRCVCLIFRFRN
jgi:16S rRNA (adenine(1408)-N(1))-methyltransferase